VTIKKVFFDANIFNDIFDENRKSHMDSKKAYLGSLGEGITVYTSCDIATNIYYITAKYTTRENALDAIDFLKTSVSIIPFGEEELTATISLMRKDSDYKDFEDAIQYILALNTKCDVIVTNDKGFTSKGVKCMNSEAFVKEFL
jgi:predicted nucleic acid-binding protein